MELNIKAFGIARDILGGSSLSYRLEAPATVDNLLTSLSRDYPEFANLASLMVAVNEEYAKGGHPIGPQDEIVLIPPVSGG